MFKSIKLEIKIAIIKLHIIDFKITEIMFVSNVIIFFLFRRKKSKITLIQAEIVVAMTKPICWYGPIKIRFKIRFINMHIKETYIGVLVSSHAKKGVTKTLIKIKAGNPRLNTKRAFEVKIESESVNSPLKNKKFTISFDKIIIPIVAGIDKRKLIFIELEICIFDSSNFFSLIFLDKTGSNAVLIAIPNTPRGSWFTLSA